MWRVWILTAVFMDSCAYMVDRREIQHGNYFSMKLQSEAEKLEYLSPDESEQYTIWSHRYIFQAKAKRGKVSGRGDGRRYEISSVTFSDAGTYTVLNYWDSPSSVVKLKVLGKLYTKNCIPGEGLFISLEGLLKDDASLRYTSNYTNVLLVDQGVPIKDNPDYFNRIKVSSSSFTVLNVNVTDLGNYTLIDRKGRQAAVIRLKLVDHHEGIDASPLMSLMLLFGLPIGICYCCRRRICRSNAPTTAVTVLQDTNFIPPPGPPPTYNNPTVPVAPGPIYTPGYPAPEDGNVVYPPPPNPAVPPQPPYNGQPAIAPMPPPNSGYVPQNPIYPAIPGYPPAPTPQWTAPYNPPAPGSAPVMYNAPAGPGPATGDIKLNEMSPATPLLTPSQPESSYPPLSEMGQPPAHYTGADVLSSSGTAVQFNIDDGKSSGSNFL